MSTVKAWLEDLGLGKYAAAFAENEIDFDQLSSLTDTDLRELGIPLGPRKRILQALTTTEISAPTAPMKPDTTAAGSTVAAPERRQLTIMFVDLVGSTALSQKLDPEDMSALIRSYQNLVAGEIARYEGHVAKFMGDGVLAYFGWPRAREDEAECAVRTALAVTAAVGRLASPAGGVLATRVGVASGLVVVGELIGEGMAQEEAVVGDTPNLAARLQSIAAPGQVIVSEATRRLLGGGFEIETLPPQILKGIDAPVQAFRVTGQRAGLTRFEARGSLASVPFVGRKGELGLLLERWRRTSDGEGLAAIVIGEPGIGKSRLARALEDEIAADRPIVLRYQGSRYHANTALWPTIDQLQRAAQFAAEDDPDRRQRKLVELLGRAVADPADAAAVLGELIGLGPLAGTARSANAALEQRDRIFDTLFRQLAGLAAQAPILLLLEDAQWIDPTTEELFGYLLDRIATIPVFVLVTARQGFRPAWIERPLVTSLTLGRLAASDAAAMVEAVDAQQLIPPALVTEIVAKADGVPLFLEELASSILGSGLLDAGKLRGGDGMTVPIAIPATLHDSLEARLDQLGSAKEAAQIAACIGRQFSREVLAAVSSLPRERLDEMLRQLIDAQLVQPRGGRSGQDYVFRQGLVQEIAYQTLLKARRRDIHRRILDVLDAPGGAAGPPQPELLAFHAERGQLPLRGAQLRLDAAHLALARHGLKEANAHLLAAIDLVAEIADPTDEPARQLERTCRVLLGDVMSLGSDVDAANAAYEAALATATKPDEVAFIRNKLHRIGYAQRAGARVAFYEHGSGSPTIVFVSPLVYGLGTFQPIIERLCQEFRVITIDCRGVGRSDPLIRPYTIEQHAQDLCAVIEAAGAAPVIGVGISRGGNQWLRLAHHRPDLIQGVMLVSSPVGTAGGDFGSYFAPDYRPRRDDLRSRGDALGLAKLQHEYVLTEPHVEGVRQGFYDAMSRLPPETILSFFDDDPTMDVAKLLPEVKARILVTHGREDRLITWQAAVAIAGASPGAGLHFFEGRGHVPTFTATEEFCDVLIRFVRGENFSVP